MNTLAEKLSNWLHIDLTYVIEGNFWLGIFRVVAIISVLVLSILFGRTLPRHVYGEYGFILAVTEILSVLTLGGFFTVIVQAVAKGYEGTFSLAIRRTLKWSLIIPFVSFAIAGYYFLQANYTYGYIFILVGITLPIYKISSFSDALLFGRKAFKIATFYNIAANISLTALLIVTLLLHANLLVLASVYLIGRTLIEFVVYISTLERFPLRNTKVQKGSESYAFHLSALKFIATVADQIDSILLFFFVGPANLALYSFAIGGPELIKGFTKNIPALALPHFSEQTLVEMRRGLSRKMLYTGLAVSLIISAYILVAPFAFKIFLPNYMDAVWYSQLFSVSVIIVAINQLPIAVLHANTEKKKLYQFTIITEIVQILLLFIGIKYYGVLGAIIAYLFTRIIRTIVVSYLVWKPDSRVLPADK